MNNFRRWEYYAVEWWREGNDHHLVCLHYNFNDIQAGERLESIDFPDIYSLVARLGGEGWEVVSESSDDNYRITSFSSHYGDITGVVNPSGRYLLKHELDSEDLALMQRVPSLEATQ